MNILETLDWFIKHNSTDEEKAFCRDYYIALNDFYEHNSNHEIFNVVFEDLCTVNKEDTEYGEKYIVVYPTDFNETQTEYRIYLRYEMRWLGYEDDYQIPVIDIKKVNYFITHEYSGNEQTLCNEQGWYYHMEDEEVETNIDEIHREALIENYEREIVKLSLENGSNKSK